mmetsp:Transcript_41741/g.134972  ORF Transcript_41741/g.134972 Transcript_41741/m.134972 type:complete len:267 (-) Transcript_41741:38-838(-)
MCASTGRRPVSTNAETTGRNATSCKALRTAIANASGSPMEVCSSRRAATAGRRQLQDEGASSSAPDRQLSQDVPRARDRAVASPMLERSAVARSESRSLQSRSEPPSAALMRGVRPVSSWASLGSAPRSRAEKARSLRASSICAHTAPPRHPRPPRSSRPAEEAAASKSSQRLRGEGAAAAAAFTSSRSKPLSRTSRKPCRTLRSRAQVAAGAHASTEQSTGRCRPQSSKASSMAPTGAAVRQRSVRNEHVCSGVDRWLSKGAQMA